MQNKEDYKDKKMNEMVNLYQNANYHFIFGIDSFERTWCQFEIINRLSTYKRLNLNSINNQHSTICLWSENDFKTILLNIEIYNKKINKLFKDFNDLLENFL